MARDLSSTIGSVAGVWKGGKGKRGRNEIPTSQSLTFPEPEMVETRTICGRCDPDDPDRFDETGPVGEVRLRFEEHVASAHADAPGRR